jgi:hypothetical protein
MPKYRYHPRKDVTVTVEAENASKGHYVAEQAWRTFHETGRKPSNAKIEYTGKMPK